MIDVHQNSGFGYVGRVLLRTAVTSLTKLNKESSFLLFFYAVVILTQFFNYVVKKSEGHQEIESVLTRATPHERKGSFLLDLHLASSKIGNGKWGNGEWGTGNGERGISKRGNL